ncbi:MAG: carbohydrate porin, partial [Caulobacteraceae bacterium]
GPAIANALNPPGSPSKPAVGPFTPLAKTLAGYGVSLRGVLIDEYADNPTGGVHQGNDNVGQLNFGADVDLQKLAGIPGGSFHTTIYRDYGFSLAKDTTGTFVKQQNIYKNAYPQLHLGLFAYEQKLFDNRVDIIVGRLGTTAYYGHLVAACTFQSGLTCGIPAILNSEAGYGLLPSATWGANITTHITSDIYFETGAFEIDPFIQHTNGFDFGTKYATGVDLPFELAWARPSLRTEAYPFELKLGGYVSTAPHADPYFNTKGQSLGLYGGTALNDTTRDGLYLMGERVIWRPDRSRTENLNVFAGIVQPLEEEEVVDEQIYSGFNLTGFIPGRPQDAFGVEGSYLRVSPREIEFLRDSRIKAGGVGSNSPNEGVFEVSYAAEIIPSLRLTPNVQYIVNPDNSMIPKTKVLPKNIVVIGLYLSFGFSNLLGFGSGGGGSD